jgi:carboxylesterase type B
MSPSTILSYTIVLFIAIHWSSTVVASPRVSTTSGILNGALNGSVNVFLGVPYSQPPVGHLRWKAALPVNRSGTEVDATQFGAACGQFYVSLGVFLEAGISTLPTKQSEDCLFLNLWAPKGGRKLPVIVFLHGGGYLSGSSNETMYRGEPIASTGRAIFVTLNYRLNIWGFPSTVPIDGIDQNIGITDVRLALEWIAENIANFGGDPSQMTIAGESSGAHLAELLLFAYDKNPIVTGQIAASGAIGMFTTNPTDGAGWNTIANASGCGNTTNASQVNSRSKMLCCEVYDFFFYTSRYLACAIFPSTISRATLFSCRSPSCLLPMIRLCSAMRRISRVGRMGHSLTFQRSLRM